MHESPISGDDIPHIPHASSATMAGWNRSGVRPASAGHNVTLLANRHSKPQKSIQVIRSLLRAV